jgi:hypothetical protein
MSFIFVRISTLVVFAALLSGCGSMPSVKRKRRAAAERALAESRRAPLTVGRVSLVNEDERFALIETDLPQTPASGTKLRIYRNNAVSAELTATGVGRRPFLVADVVSGNPEKGDVVLQPSAMEGAPAKASPAAAAATPTPAVQPPKKRWLGLFGRRK